MKENKLALLASVVIGVAGVQSAAANEPGFYIGGYLGQASKHADKFPFVDLTAALQEVAAFQPVDEQTSFDDKDTTYGLFGGYRLNKYLAFEVAYTKLGKVSYKSRATGNYPLEPGSLVTTVESESSGFNVSVLGTLPLNRDWDLFARGGVLFGSNTIRFDLRAQGSQFIPPTGNHAADSFSDGSTDYLASLGINHRILEIYDLRLEYQRVFDAGVEITGGEADVNAVLLGLSVTF
jgi:opacity protein-like surface antigen